MSGAQRRVLRALIEARSAEVVPGVYDGITVRLAERAGFGALYISGAAVSMSLLGQPDIGLLGLAEMVGQVHRAAAISSLPLIVDADTGYGGPLQVARTVMELELAGAAAIQIEDQVAPKRCGHLDGKQVVPLDSFLPKLRAAVEVRRSEDTLVIARTDAREEFGLPQAIDRANRFAEAGADMVFVEGLLSQDEIEVVAAEVEAPLVLNLPFRGKTPLLPISTVRELGYALVLYPGIGVVPAVDAIEKALRGLSQGQIPSAANTLSPAELFERVGAEHWDLLERELASEHSNNREEAPT